LLHCPTCGSENEDSARFCGDCGAPLALTCPNCGASAFGGKRFCQQCGAALGSPTGAAAAEPTAPAPPPAERRLISALFADLVGFTSISETKDAEEVRDLLVRFADVARAVVERYGGVVDNFIGDAVFAVWGTPIAHEDDAERAVRCGLDLVDAIAVLGGQIGIAGLAARAGVLTGEAAVHQGDPTQRLVAGDLVNTASRLQTAAAPGSVFVGEATYLATNHAIAFSEIGELALKGKDEPVRAWRALRVVSKTRGAERPEGVEPPFVGRDEELRVLKDALNSLHRDRRARLISVTGIPGIGKSRLSWEIHKYADGVVDNFYWHHGRSPAYGEGVTFWALAEMVRMRAQISEDEDAADTRDKLAQTIAEFVADPDERNWIAPRLSHLLGLADAPSGTRDETFAAWRRFFESVAEKDPVVMVFEDLQWADNGLIDFIESLLEWSRSQPILVVALSRPELYDRRPNWGAGQRSFTSVHLEPLAADAMHELLVGLIPGLPDHIAERLLERAEGVPLFAVEIVRMLAGKGLLVEVDGAYEISGELSEVELPDSLHALIASRLDALPTDERTLIQDASVLGKSFTVAALAAITGREQSELEVVLRDLVRREFLTIDLNPRSPERGQYGFLQGVIREVAYSTLARRDRRARHVAAAEYLQSLSGDELAGVVASHYLEAYRSSPDDATRDELGRASREALVVAGKRALSLGAPDQALVFAEQALEVASPGLERAEIAEFASQAAATAAKVQAAIEYADRAFDEFTAHGDKERAARAITRMLRGRPSVDKLEVALSRGEEIFSGLGEEGDPLVRANLASTVAMLHRQGGHDDASIAWAERALSFAERTDDPEGLARAVVARSYAAHGLGRRREAAILLRGALEIVEAAGLAELQAEWLTLLAVFSTDDDPRETLNFALRGAEMSRRIGHRIFLTINLVNIAEFGVMLGEWETTRAAHSEFDELEIDPAFEPVTFRRMTGAFLDAFTVDPVSAIRESDAIGEEIRSREDKPMHATHLWHRAYMKLVAGDLPGARADAEASFAVEPTGINASEALALKARAELWLGDQDGARSTRALMESFRGRLMSAMRTTTDAGLAALQGRVDDALALYESVARTWEELDSPLDRALCALDQVVMLGDHVAAADGARTAREVFTRLRSGPLLDLVEMLQRGSVPSHSDPT
jgi:class 3 adenylate cyclase/tetratricopeptide (TPR) repeat protein